MTNHNALISDAKGSIGVAVRVPNQSLFSPGGGRYISIPRKKLVQKLEADPSQTRIHTWIEAMRASSPTRTRPGTYLPSRSPMRRMNTLLGWLNTRQL
ncbi:putative trehalose-phosphatase [Arabidopsis thaliana]